MWFLKHSSLVDIYSTTINNDALSIATNDLIKAPEKIKKTKKKM